MGIVTINKSKYTENPNHREHSVTNLSIVILDEIHDHEPEEKQMWKRKLKSLYNIESWGNVFTHKRDNFTPESSKFSYIHKGARVREQTTTLVPKSPNNSFSFYSHVIKFRAYYFVYFCRF